MIKPHDGLGAIPKSMNPCIEKKFTSAKSPIARWAALTLAALSCAAAQPSPKSSAEQEQRRALDRERATREYQEKTPDVQLQEKTRPEPATLPASESPCFRINQLSLDGGSFDRSFDASPFQWALKLADGPSNNDSPVGRCLGAVGIGVVIKRIHNAIIAGGYVTTRVLVEPQDLTSGKLRLTLIPGRIRDIRFSPNSNMYGSIFTAVPAKVGDLLNLRDVEQALENFKRVPTAEVDIQIEAAKAAGAQPGQSDLVINYTQSMPLRLSVFADDSGSEATGKYQSGVTLSYDNWWTLNDLFYVALNTDLGGGADGGRGTRGRTVHYSLPKGYWTLGATASANRYFQTVAGGSQDFVYRGTSTNTEVKVSRLVYRDISRRTSISAKAFQRRSNNFIDDTEVEVQRRVVGGWELGVGHKEFMGTAILEGNIAYKRGTGAFSSLPAPEEFFGEGTSRFALVQADAGLTLPFAVADQNLRYTASWRLQHNRTPLTPQERFAIGGRYTVRGFDGESNLSAERGWLMRNEISALLGDTGHQLYIGLDHGQVSGFSSELLVGKRLTGAVSGLRGSFSRLQYDLFVGAPVKKPEFFRTASRTAGFSLSASF